jgi:hypothetical protein
MLGVGVNCHDRHLLLGYEFRHVIEKIQKLHQVLFDLQHFLVALLDSTQHAIGLFGAAAHDGLLEDLRVAVHNVGNLGVGGVRVHDTGLAFHADLHILAGGRLELLKLLDRLPEVPVGLVDLGNVSRVAAVRVRLDKLDAIRQSSVLVHYRLGEIVELSLGVRAARHIRIVEGPPLKTAKRSQLVLEVLNCAVYVGTFVED